MKTWTIKDFIQNNSPCLNCQQNMLLYVVLTKPNSVPPHLQDEFFLLPHVCKDYIEIDLNIRYDNCLKLFVYQKSNKITTNSLPGLQSYLHDCKLHFTLECKFCDLHINTQYAKFCLDQSFMRPIKIDFEYLTLNCSNTKMIVMNNYRTNESTVQLISKKQEFFHLPLINRNSLDKKSYFQKIQKYLMLS
jgi:hypothetical protein